MGWIRLGINKPSPAKQLHNVAARVETKNLEYETSDYQTTSSPKHQNDRHYPFQPQRTSTADLPYIEASEVAKRTGEDGARLWIVVDSTVLDVTQYISSHPGGQQIVRGFGGQECSWQWWTFHNRKVWSEVASTLRVGRTQGIDNRHVKPKAFVGLRGLGYHEDWS